MGVLNHHTWPHPHTEQPCPRGGSRAGISGTGSYSAVQRCQRQGFLPAAPGRPFRWALWRPGWESRVCLRKQEQEVLPRRSASKTSTWSSALSSDLGCKEDQDRQGVRATPPRTLLLKRPHGHSSSNSKNQALHRIAILFSRRGNRGSAECHPLRTAHRYHRTPALLSP